jgi:large subunit ribosomal protein L21
MSSATSASALKVEEDDAAKVGFTEKLRDYRDRPGGTSATAGGQVSGCKPCYNPWLCGNPSAELTQEVYMYAVIKTGGKQYRVASGEKIKVEQIAADVGQEIVIDQVLAVGNGAELKVGTPLVSGATVKATVVAHGKHDKVRIFKMRRRKHYQKRQGHRQQFTELQIGAIAA